MAFSSVHEMIDLCKESGKPLYEVILESDLAESGLTRAESEAEMHRLWAVMQATSRRTTDPAQTQLDERPLRAAMRPRWSRPIKKERALGRRLPRRT